MRNTDGVIAFDLQAVQSVGNNERGIARYVTETVRALTGGPHRDIVDVFVWNDRLPWTDRLHDLGVNDRLASFSEMRGRRVDVLHVNSPFESPNVGDLLAPVRARRLVVTCYDLIPRLFPEWYLTDRHVSAAYRRRLGLIAAADAVVTDSQSAADDVVGHLGVDPERVTVLGGGVAGAFAPPTTSIGDRIADLRREWPHLSARYVLVPTAADRRKNSVGALTAFADLPDAVRRDHQLVLFCRLTDGQRRDLERCASGLGIADRVVFTGYVPDELLVPLYQSAELVFFPTFYEGFGLPVVEARHCGARVICSNSSSLPEVLGDVDARFNPHDRADTARALRRALTDAEHIARLDRVPDSGFTWRLVADRLAGVYARVAGDAVRPPTSATIRVGVVGRLDRHGDAEVEFVRGDVLEPLAGDPRITVTAFAVGPPPPLTLRPTCPVLPLAALSEHWQADDIDVVLYVATDRTLRRLMQLTQCVPGHFLPVGPVAADVTDRVLSVASGTRTTLADRLAAAVNASAAAT